MFESPQITFFVEFPPSNSGSFLLAGTTVAGGSSTKYGYLWTLKHDISLPKFYELLINTELNETLLWKSRTSTTTYNMCLIMVTRL